MVLLEKYHTVRKALEFHGMVGCGRTLTMRREAENSSTKLLPKHVGVHFSVLKWSLNEWRRESRALSNNILAPPPDSLTGNLQIYRLLGEILEKSVANDDDKSLLRFFSKAADLRTVEGTTPSEAQIGESSNDYTCLALMSVHDIFSDLYTNSVKRLEICIKDPSQPGSYVSRGKYSLASAGALIYVSAHDKSCVLSVDHFERLLETLLTYRNYCLLGSHNGVRVVSFLRKMSKLGERYPEKLGEGTKACRNLLTWRLSKDMIFDRSSEQLLKSSYDEWKQDIAEKVMDYIDDLTPGVAESISMAYFYKYIPHPDVDIIKCYDAVRGITSANPVEPEALKLLSGSLRRSLFLASVKSGDPLRIVGGDAYLASESAKPSPSFDVMSRVPNSRWARTVFGESHKYSSYLDVVQRVQDKSHAAMSGNLPREDVPFLNKPYLMGDVKHDFEKSTIFESDMYLRYIKDDVPTPAQARSYFITLVRLHTAYEEKLGHKPNLAELQSFYRESPDAFHVVATEGKYGETHKETTRMFYLSNMYMKVFLSCVERLVKQLSQAQLGNSITKGNLARESDLRTFAHGAAAPGGKAMPVYLSFDMSEFSKKFNPENIKALGKLLSEITGDWALEYLDIAFRSATVANQTRGLSSNFPGVEGGFEGFLNFGWTAIHVAVMQISLQEAGVYGVVLAYSDDGVLYFLIEGPLEGAREKIRRAVLSIQETYKKLGLVFHIGKMLCSTTTFEYLGEVGDDGRFLEPWPKALSKLGIMEKSTSLSTVGDYFSTLSGQWSAVAADGFPALMLEKYVLLSGYRKIKRIFSSITPHDAFALMITPKSCGGFGVPCSMNVSLIMSRDQTSEFLCDISGVSRLYPNLTRKLISYLLSNMCDSTEALPKMLMGSSLAVNIQDVSGTSILISAGNALRRRIGAAEVEHPLTTRRAQALREVIRTMTEVTPTLMQSLIEKCPEMSDYQAVVQEGKSKGAVKLLGKGELMRYQSMDTKAVQQGIRRYCEHTGRAGDLPELLGSINRLLRSNGFSVIKPSLRALVKIVTQPRSDIKVFISRENISDSGLGSRRPHTFFNLPFLQPLSGSGLKADRIIFDSESRNDKQVPHKLLELVSSIVSRHPSVSKHLSTICGILGSPLPDLLGFSGANINRSRVRSRKQDISNVVPPILIARSKVNLGSDLLRAYTSKQNMDRTTIEYFAKAVAAIEFMNLNFMCERPSTEAFRISMNVSDFDVALFDPEMFSIAPSPQFDTVVGVGARRERELMDTFAKSIREQRVLDDVISLDNCDRETLNLFTRYLAMKLVKKVKRRLNAAHTVDNLQPVQLVTSSETYNQGIIQEAALQLVVDASVKNHVWSKKQYEEVVQVILKSRDEVCEELRALYESLPTGFYVDVGSVSVEGVVNALNERQVSSSLFSSSKILVSDRGDMHGRDPVISQAAYVARKTISELYRISNEEDWRARFTVTDSAISKAANSGVDADDVLDMLHICHDSLRRSNHRKELYNKTTFIIYSYMLHCCTGPGHEAIKVEGVPEGSDSEEEEVTELQSSAYQLSTSEIEQFLLRNPLLGPDHRKILIGITPPKVTLRIGIYRKMRKKLPNPDPYSYATTTQGIFYAMLSTVLSNKIVTINVKNIPVHALDYSAVRPFLPAAPYPNTIVSGDGMSFDPLSLQLSWANIQTLMLREGIVSIRFSKEVDREVINTKLDSIAVSLTGIDLHVDSGPGGSLCFICEKFLTARAALLSLACHVTYGECELSVVRVNRDNYDWYVLCGGIISPEQCLTEMSYEELVRRDPDWITEKRAMQFVPSSVDDHITSVLASNGSYRHMVLEASPTRYMHDALGINVRSVSRPAVVLNSSPMIAAAAAMSSAGTTVGQSYWAHVLLETHATGGDLATARETYISDIDDLSAANPRRRATLILGMEASAARVRSYFVYNPVIQSVDLVVPDDMLAPPPTTLPEFRRNLDFAYIPARTHPISRLIEAISVDEVVDVLSDRLGDADDLF